MALYNLDVPTVTAGTESGVARYGCCHKTEEQGHAETCVPETRASYIEAALERTGISFQRSDVVAGHFAEMIASRLVRVEVLDEDREWLADFLDHAPDIDPHDDEADIVSMLAPFAALLRTCLDERDRRAELDKQPGDEEEPQKQLPVEALIESNDAMRAFLRPVAGVALTDSMLEEMRVVLAVAKIKGEPREFGEHREGDPTVSAASVLEPDGTVNPTALEGLLSKPPDGTVSPRTPPEDIFCPDAKDPAKRLHDLVTEPTVVEELHAAQASIEHALFRLGR